MVDIKKLISPFPIYSFSFLIFGGNRAILKMGSNLEERQRIYEKSVNIAIKRFCNKIETMNGEMKQWKEEIIKDVKKDCKNCKCSEITSQIENKVETFEGKLLNIIKKDADDAKKIENEINDIKKDQKVNMKEINSLDTKIESLNLEQIKVEEKCKGFKESIKIFGNGKI